MASDDELVTRKHSRQYVAGLSSCFTECGLDEECTVSFEAEYTYPDGSKDMLRVGLLPLSQHFSTVRTRYQERPFLESV